MKLIDHWPAFLGEIEDFKQLAQAQQPEFDRWAEAVGRAPEDFFLSTLSEAGAARWEAALSLVPAPGDSLALRRARILAAYAGRLPYTVRALLQYLATACGGGRVTVLHAEYIVKVALPSAALVKMSQLQQALRAMVPANMELHIGSGFVLELHTGAALAHRYSYTKFKGGA